MKACNVRSNSYPSNNGHISPVRSSRNFASSSPKKYKLRGGFNVPPPPPSYLYQLPKVDSHTCPIASSLLAANEEEDKLNENHSICSNNYNKALRRDQSSNLTQNSEFSMPLMCSRNKKRNNFFASSSEAKAYELHDTRFYRRIFSVPNLFHKRKKQKLALIQVVKEIWEEAQILKKQRTEMEDGWVGEVGLALFFPIYWDEIEEESSSSSEEESEDFEDDIIMEHEPDLKSSPPILSNAQLQQIQTKLPAVVTVMSWTRAYSVFRDGDCFRTMLEKVANYQHTLTVIRTKDGDILGGFADTAWGRQRSTNLKKTRSFFGGGRAFLFTTRPEFGCDHNEMKEGISHESNLCNSRSDTINFYRWTGENEYCQICDVEKGCLGMGGGGSFGWFIQDNFTFGSSGPCRTFSNPPLTKADSGDFEVVDFEMYGFKSMSERSFDPTLSSRSLNSFERKAITSMFE